ncbi:hypothetical protein [Oceanobacillus sp. 1P07AA]|uniref:hypothetical protein n=1 Tax=Oceanobacillus sp. 1P07AA TaxID=3132293 RepID=UPI0039A4BA89
MNLLQQFYQGKTTRLSRTFTNDDVEKSKALTRDVSPIYDEREKEWKAYYKKPVIPALLTEGLITEAISSKLPGSPCVLLQKDLVFYSPVHVGQKITVELTIIDVNEERNWLTQKVTCFDDQGNEVIRGQVVLLLLIDNDSW